MASATEAVTEKVKEGAEKAKEKLVGYEEDPHVPKQTSAEFMKYAVQDEETGDYYMGQKEFVDAIAPADEDYVRIIFSFIFYLSTSTCTRIDKVWHGMGGHGIMV